MKLLLALLMACALAFPARAETGTFQLFMEYGQAFRIPVPLLLAISKQESGFNPHAINVAGRSYLPDTREEALKLARAAQKKGQSFDVGLMQVNSWWLKRYGISLEHAFDPQVNILLGAFILSEEIRKSGGINWQSVGAYHSPRTARKKAYSRSILNQLAALEAMAGKAQ